MKQRFYFILFLAALSMFSGYMLSKASFVGRAGISLFYREYSFLKVWWQAGLVVFAILIIIYGLMAIIYQRASKPIARGAQITGIFLALTGLVLTYNDFRDDLSHRWLGERFHIGAYCFWIGWITIGIFWLLQPKRGNIIAPGNKDSLIP